MSKILKLFVVSECAGSSLMRTSRTMINRTHVETQGDEKINNKLVAQAVTNLAFQLDESNESGITMLRYIFIIPFNTY